MPVSHNRRKEGEPKILHKYRLIKRKKKLEEKRAILFKQYKLEMEEKVNEMKGQLQDRKKELHDQGVAVLGLDSEEE